MSDVSTAFLHATRQEPVWANPPKESQERARARGEISRDKQCRWKIIKSLYGLRDSPREWQEHLVLIQQGWKQVERDDCLFTKGSCVLMVYVDDLLSTGEREELEAYLQELGQAVTLKTRVHSSNEDCEEEYLGRIIRQRSGVLSIGMHKKYAQKTAELLGMTQAKPVGCCSLPSVGENEALSKDEASLYRRVVGCLMWLQQERPDICVPVSITSQAMPSPGSGDMKALRKLVRYLNGCQASESVLAPCRLEGVQPRSD